MNNFALFFVTIVGIIFIVGIILTQNSKTKKLGLSIIFSVAVIAMIRYFYVNYTYVGINYFADSLTEDFVIIFLGLITIAFFASPFAFLIGLFLAIKGSKYRKIGLFFMIGAVIAFIVGINTCKQIHI